jgi:hypothetical protein
LRRLHEAADIMDLQAHQVTDSVLRMSAAKSPSRNE